MSSKRLVITIDGPAGSGKSTIARGLADKLGYLFLDTGAIYRTVALASQRAQLPWCSESKVAAVAQEIVEHGRLQFAREADGAQSVWLSGENVTLAIRAPEISAGASAVSAHPLVRSALLDLQRSVARNGGVVAEGRDTGSVVFPDADCKFFMSASASERARRRVLELQAKGVEADFNETLLAMEVRDRQDRERSVAPLCRPDGALDIDTTGISIEQVLASMLELVERTRLEC